MKSMRVRMRLRTLPALLLASLLVACGDIPSAPFGSVAPDGGDSLSVGRALSQSVLFACETPDFGSVTQRIGPQGGIIEIGPHSLIIPAGALPGAVDITASAPASPHVSVAFAPHGLRFHEPAALVLSYKHCELEGPRRPSVAYVDDLQSSIIELLPSKHDKLKKAVTASLEHFSGYAIAD